MEVKSISLFKWTDFPLQVYRIRPKWTKYASLQLHEYKVSRNNATLETLASININFMAGLVDN